MIGLIRMRDNARGHFTRANFFASDLPAYFYVINSAFRHGLGS